MIKMELPSEPKAVVERVMAEKAKFLESDCPAEGTERFDQLGT